MDIRSFTYVCVAGLILSGCSTSPYIGSSEQPDSPSISYDSLYVRGVFNWWEADERFRLTASGNGVYTVIVDLIADGQPYDFRLSDAIWSPHASCGFESVVAELIEGQWYTLYCGADSQNMQFIPQETGRFSIQVQPSSNGQGDTLLSIQQI